MSVSKEEQNRASWNLLRSGLYTKLDIFKYTRYLEKKTIRSFFPWRCFDKFLVFPVAFGGMEAAGGAIPSSVH